MIKSCLIETVSDGAGVKKSQAEDAVNIMLRSIEEALANDETVTLVGFGTFTTHLRRARRGRNPKTGEEIEIESKKVIKFKPGSRLLKEIRE